MKRILHMTPPDINNGVHRYIFNHMPYIDQKEYQFAFLTKAAGELMRTKEYKKYRFPVYCLHNTERENKIAMEKEIRSILQDGYDVLHLHTSSWRGFFIEEIAMDMGIGKVIVHSHSTGIDEMDVATRQERLCTHEQYKSQFSMKFATDVCACSWKAADWLFGDQISREQIKVLPNAIDVEKYRFDPYKRQKLREKLGLNGKVVLGNVGRYCFQKNQEFLVKVFAKAHERNKNLFLLCIGQGENIAEIRHLIDELGISDSACCLSWQTNIEDYLQVMDVFCLPSHFEGFPISVVEAQAAGLRCLISDTVTRECDLTEQVLFLPLNEQIWLEALQKVSIDDSRTIFSQRVAERGYDLRSAARKLTDLYDGKSI